MERGYVKLYRKTLDSGILQNPHVCQLFCYLLLNATRNKREKLVGSVMFTLEPGDSVFGRARVAHDLNMSEQNVRTALSVLERMKIVTTKATNRCTIVSFVKWDIYQGCEPATSPADCPASNQQVTSKSPQDKKERMLNTPLPPKGERVKEFHPPTLDEVRQYVEAKGRQVDPDEFWNFYDRAGWLNNGEQIRSWKNLLNTWHKKRSVKEATSSASSSGNRIWTGAGFSDAAKWTEERTRKNREIHAEYDGVIRDLKRSGKWQHALNIERMRDDILEEAGVAEWQ